MKHCKLLAFLSFSLISNFSWSQVGIGTTSPAASSQLEVTSSTKGVLIPRVALTSLTSASPISSPATSLLIYNTASAGTFPNNVTPGYYFWDGTTWKRFQDQNNPGELQWNYVEGNPTQNSLGATFVGSTTWSTNYIQLTPNSGGQNGKVYWVQDIDWDQPLHISLQFYAGGGSGADGNWFFFGANSTAIGSGSTHSTNAGGISVFFDELNDQVHIYKSGTLINSFSTLTSLDNSQWQVHELYFGKKLDGTRFLDIKTNNGQYLGTASLGSFSAAGDYVGAGAWTGASTNLHGFRRVVIQSGLNTPR